jgi:hypothetical protein
MSMVNKFLFREEMCGVNKVSDRSLLLKILFPRIEEVFLKPMDFNCNSDEEVLC